MPERNLSDDRLAVGVRRAFSRYAAPATVPPVLPRDIASGQRRIINISLVALPAAVLVLVIALATQTLLRPSSAFATWTAEPGEAEPGLAATAANECASQLPLIALDQRGRVAVALFSDGASIDDCLLVDGIRSAGSHGAETGLDPSGGPIEVLNHGQYEREASIHIFSGGVRSEVASVVVTRDDGVEVTATVSGGVFVVWWPAAVDAATFTAFDAAGNVIETIDNPIRLPIEP